MRPLPKAAMFALAEQGHRSLFEQLVACILSIRTRDEVSLVAAQRLFAAAPSPRALAALDRRRIDTLIGDTTFHADKAHQIREIARVADRHGGELPCDVHVHRVTNRWGYVSAPTPERTMAELERRLPPRYWVEINSLLVPFGKRVCTGRPPKCSTCPVLEMCRQVGVEAHR